MSRAPGVAPPMAEIRNRQRQRAGNANGGANAHDTDAYHYIVPGNKSSTARPVDHSDQCSDSRPTAAMAHAAPSPQPERVSKDEATLAPAILFAATSSATSRRLRHRSRMRPRRHMRYF